METVRMRLAKVRWPSLFESAGMAKSRSDARRLIDAGAVTVDDVRLDSYETIEPYLADCPDTEFLVRIGKKMVRLKVATPKAA